MIKLTQITQTDLGKYKSIFIEEEIIELTENYKYPLDESKDKAIKEFDKCFPDEKTQKNEFLLSIKSDQFGSDKTLGYLWFSISDDYVFVLDFYIQTEFRSRGFDAQTMKKLQEICLEKSINQLRLRVANNNPRALKLYQELGFSITGTNLMKKF
ncbi:MAG: GNAT family N-acetyltransferase [Marinicellaceae bacterium]